MARSKSDYHRLSACDLLAFLGISSILISRDKMRIVRWMAGHTFSLEFPLKDLAPGVLDINAKLKFIRTSPSVCAT